eukprot:TRINITY_DN11603_c0_g1_i1.p1 TRINITY_DN11603_c0_g1~~TRINITY_DN11603_c0_g1_i1.p1  ORF type:complete len:398 (-),score=68.27 TRINITY_DN11603_c0_g1_i1:27-1190(-)
MTSKNEEITSTNTYSPPQLIQLMTPQKYMSHLNFNPSSTFHQLDNLERPLESPLNMPSGHLGKYSHHFTPMRERKMAIPSVEVLPSVGLYGFNDVQFKSTGVKGKGKGRGVALKLPFGLDQENADPNIESGFDPRMDDFIPEMETPYVARSISRSSELEKQPKNDAMSFMDSFDIDQIDISTEVLQHTNTDNFYKNETGDFLIENDADTHDVPIDNSTQCDQTLEQSVVYDDISDSYDRSEPSYDGAQDNLYLSEDQYSVEEFSESMDDAEYFDDTANEMDSHHLDEDSIQLEDDESSLEMENISEENSNMNWQQLIFNKFTRDYDGVPRQIIENIPPPAYSLKQIYADLGNLASGNEISEFLTILVDKQIITKFNFRGNSYWRRKC